MSGLTTMGDAEALARKLHDATHKPSRAADQDTGRAPLPWADWPMGVLDRVPVPYWLIVVVIAAGVAGEQLFELSLIDQTLARTSAPLGPSLVFPVLALYILTHLRILKKAAIEALTDLRPSVRISDKVYEEHARRLICADPRMELVLLGVTLAIVLFLFLGLDADLLHNVGGLPSSPPAAAVIVLTYTLVGWLILSLVYCALRSARALRALASHPLEVNVFDPANLLPFGRLSLLGSLPTVALILIPTVLLGPPTQAGYLVILLSVVSVLSLFLPLWGVHQQIDGAKEAVLNDIYRRLLVIQDDLLNATTLDSQILDNMSDHTAILVRLRELIQQSPNWPFKDTLAVMRAMVAVSSPLVYFILDGLIDTLVIPLLTGSAP